MLYETITLYFTDNSMVSNRNHFSCLLLNEITEHPAAESSSQTFRRLLFFCKNYCGLRGEIVTLRRDAAYAPSGRRRHFVN